MATHERKCELQYFQALWNEEKTVELREEDPEHPFGVGDRIILREWKPDLTVGGLDGWDAVVAARDLEAAETLAHHLEARGYTGRSLVFMITHVLRDPEGRWIQPGVVALSLKPVEEPIPPIRHLQEQPTVFPSPDPTVFKRWSKDEMKEVTRGHLADVLDCESHLAHYHQDHHQIRRQYRQHCRYCTYLDTTLATQGFTPYVCAHCSASHTHESSHVPRLCSACANSLDACVQCGGALD